MSSKPKTLLLGVFLALGAPVATQAGQGRRLAVFLLPSQLSLPSPDVHVLGAWSKDALFSTHFLNEAKITLGGRIALGCPVQTMSLEWLSLSRNCPGGGWRFNEHREQSYPIMPRVFPPECVFGLLSTELFISRHLQGSAPQLLSAWLAPLISQCLVN